MKIFVCLSALVAVAFAGQPVAHTAVDASQVTCSETSIVFAGTAANFPRYAGAELKLGGCALGDDFGVDADVNACGLVRGTDGDLVTISTTLLSPPATGVITRRKPVKLTVSCAYNRKTQGSTAAVQPILGEIVGDLSQTGATVDVALNLLDDTGAVVATGDSLPVSVGNEVTAQVTGPHLKALGLNAFATDCWVTSKNDPADTLRWNLITGNCPNPEDDTFSIAADGNGQLMRFEAFSFTADETATLYLHCEIEACLPALGCGKCSTSRRRRSVRNARLLVSQEIEVY